MKILTASQIEKKIETIRTSGVRFQNAVQEATVSAVAHVAKSRDKTMISRIYEAMPNGSRRKTLIDWLNSHIGEYVESKYTKDGKLNVELAPEKSPEWEEFTHMVDAIVDVMAAEQWHAYSPDRGDQDGKVTLDQIIAYMERKNKKAANDDADQIGKVIEFARALKA